MKEAVGLSRTYVCSYITFDYFFQGGGGGGGNCWVGSHKMQTNLKTSRFSRAASSVNTYIFDMQNK